MKAIASLFRIVGLFFVLAGLFGSMEAPLLVFAIGAALIFASYHLPKEDKKP